ncbi:MAG TPA: hypothetical protein VM734_00625 [Kofleriaceae bacterium]|jgi:hypothetical protein|nr:hypothetical protein [Kofleriaceae bacterium]
MRSLAPVLLIATFVAACSSSKPAPATTPANVAGPAVAPAEPAEPATPAEPAEPAAVTGEAPGDAEVADVVAKATVLFTDLGDAIAHNASNCGAMAIAIDQTIDRHRPFLVESKRWKGNAAVEAKMLEGLQQTGVLEKTMEKMVPGLQACGTDPKVQAALAKMED